MYWTQSHSVALCIEQNEHTYNYFVTFYRQRTEHISSYVNCTGATLITLEQAITLWFTDKNQRDIKILPVLLRNMFMITINKLKLLAILELQNAVCKYFVYHNSIKRK